MLDLILAGMVWKQIQGMKEKHPLVHWTPPGVAPEAAPIPPRSLSCRIMPHILFYGNGGRGKTSLAFVVSQELRHIYGVPVNFYTLTPSDLSNPAQIINILSKLQTGDVVFIDEIHGLEQVIEETLYAPMQDYRYYLPDGGMLDLPKFTLIGATTCAGRLNKPFLDRFTIGLLLEGSTVDNLVHIISDRQHGASAPTCFDEYHGQEKAKLLLGIHMMSLKHEGQSILPDEVNREIAKRALTNPRIAIQFSTHCTAYLKAIGYMNLMAANEVFDLLGVDRNGLHEPDRQVIKILKRRNNKPMGLGALATAAGVDKADLELMIEPRLDTCGFLERNSTGRSLTQSCLSQY